MLSKGEARCEMRSNSSDSPPIMILMQASSAASLGEFGEHRLAKGNQFYRGREDGKKDDRWLLLLGRISALYVDQISTAHISVPNRYTRPAHLGGGENINNSQGFQPHLTTSSNGSSLYCCFSYGNNSFKLINVEHVPSLQQFLQTQ